MKRTAKTFTMEDFLKMPLKPLISKATERKIRAAIRRDVAYMKTVFRRVKV